MLREVSLPSMQELLLGSVNKNSVRPLCIYSEWKKWRDTTFKRLAFKNCVPESESGWQRQRGENALRKGGVIGGNLAKKILT